MFIDKVDDLEMKWRLKNNDEMRERKFVEIMMKNVEVTMYG